jgi:hypothetical protein
MRTLTAIPFLLLLVGCAATRTYQVSIKNDTANPITIGLVKEGDPFEGQWASPEEAAIAGQEPSAQMWAAVPPGKTADTGPVQGKFNSKADAVLRIYEGKLNLSGILAVSRDQPNRRDILLHPGLNRLTITQRDGKLEATRAEDGATTISQQ